MLPKLIKYGQKLGFLCINNKIIREKITLKLTKISYFERGPRYDTLVKILSKWFDNLVYIGCPILDTLICAYPMSVTDKKVEGAEFS